MSTPLPAAPDPEGSAAPQVMGILNVTPDSFSDGGQLAAPADLLARAAALVRDGATWLDVGAESTRPGATPIDAQTELGRLRPALAQLLAARLPARISVDTRRAAVAAVALEMGAHAINDVSALGDPDMGRVVAEAGVPIVLMHWRGPAPLGGHHGVRYEDVVQEVCAELRVAVARATAAGIAPPNIWLDPGLGFGKRGADSLALTRGLAAVVGLGHPVVYGASRKGFLGEATGRPTAQRDAATAAACCIAVLHGAQVLRVHAPAAVRDAVAVAWAVRRA